MQVMTIALCERTPSPLFTACTIPAKLRGDPDLKRFPRLAPLVSNKSRLENEKAVLFLHRHFPDKVSKGFPIKAIVIPRISNGVALRLTPATAGAALAALAPSTLMQLPGSGQSAIKTLSKLIHQVPAYFLSLGPDTARIPEAVQSLLSGR